MTYDPGMADLSSSGYPITVTVDTNATGFGAILYEASDGHYDEADASAIATCGFPVIALETGTGSKKVLIDGWIKNAAWTWTVGGDIFISETTGGLTQTAPTTLDSVSRKVGKAETANIIRFCPSLNFYTHT